MEIHHMTGYMGKRNIQKTNPIIYNRQLWKPIGYFIKMIMLT